MTKSGEITEADHEAFAETEDFKREAGELLWDLMAMPKPQWKERVEAAVNKANLEFENFLRRS